MNDEQIDLMDKMGQAHRDMLRRMLGVNEIPLLVLKRYFSIKKPLDKVDGFFSICDLLRIAMDCGFNPETGLFGELKVLSRFSEEDIERIRNTKPGDMIIVDDPKDIIQVIKKPESHKPISEQVEPKFFEEPAKEVVTEPEENAEAAQPVEEAETEETAVIEDSETVTASSSEAVAEPAEEIPEPEEDDDEPTETLEQGVKVRAFIDGKIVEGEIAGSREEGGDILYGISTDEGLRPNVPIDNIEVV